jgi:hypothetical protein
MIRHLLPIFLISIPCFLHAQNIAAFKKTMDKQEYSKAWKPVEKALAKDSLNPMALYLASVYFNGYPGNPEADLDTAHFFISQSIRVYRSLPAKLVDKYTKRGLSSTLLDSQKALTDSLAFHWADSLGTEEAYRFFTMNYPEARQLAQAVAARDQLAFEKAQKGYTWQSFKRFLDLYPNSVYAGQALVFYDKLLFETLTAAGTLESYEQFIAEYPESPYRLETEALLHTKFTTDNTLETHNRFLQKYPENRFGERSWAWIWYLSPDKQALLNQYPVYRERAYAHDYLIRDTTNFYLFFHQETKKYGFIDQWGTEKIGPRFPMVKEDYFCGAVEDPFIVFFDEKKKAGLVSLSGEVIVTPNFGQIVDFGPGVARTEREGKQGLIHLTGYTLIEPVFEELSFLTTHLVKAKKEGKWTVIAYNGTPLLNGYYDEVQISNQMVSIRQYGKFAYVDEPTLLKHALSEPFQPRFLYDRYEVTHEHFLKLQQGNRFMLKAIGSEQFLVEDAEEIKETTMGWVVKKNTGYSLLDRSGSRITMLDYGQVISGAKGYGVKIANKWGFVNFQGELIIQPVYDTLTIIGDKGIIMERDKKKVAYFYQQELTDFTKYDKLTVQSTQVTTDSALVNVPLIITQDARNRKGLLSGTGQVILDNKYQQVMVLKEGMVAVEVWGKRGLVDLQGKTLLNPAYDGIMDFQHQYVHLLRNKKFGLYHRTSGATIPAEYDNLLKFYGKSDSLFVARKGLLGIVNQRNEVLADFVFQEIHYWTDESILVKHENRWKVYHFAKRYFTADVFDTFEFIRNDAEEVVIMTYRSSGYGVLSSKKGRIIPEEYSDIYNLGSPRQPFFLVERDITQAGLHVLLYINQDGKMVRRQVLSEEEYELIFCQDQ